MILEYRNMVGYITKMQDYLRLINGKLNQEVFRAAGAPPLQINQYVPPQELSPIPNIDPYRHQIVSGSGVAATSATSGARREHQNQVISEQIEGLETSIRSSFSDDLNRE